MKHRKRRTVHLWTILLLVLLPGEVRALSLQLSVGNGSALSDRRDEYGSSFNTDVTVFLYEAQSVEFFVGGNYIQFYSKHTRPSGVILLPVDVDLTLKAIALTGGFRFKLPITKRWTSYLALGGLMGSGNYSGIVPLGAVFTSIPISEDVTFITYRAGLGSDIKFGTRFSLGIEINIHPAPAFETIVFRDPFTGEVTDAKFYESVQMIWFTLGFRYYF